MYYNYQMSSLNHNAEPFFPIRYRISQFPLNPEASPFNPNNDIHYLFNDDVVPEWYNPAENTRILLVLGYDTDNQGLDAEDDDDDEIDWFQGLDAEDDDDEIAWFHDPVDNGDDEDTEIPEWFDPNEKTRTLMVFAYGSEDCQR